MNKYKLTVMDNYGNEILSFEFKEELDTIGTRLRFENKDGKTIEVIPSKDCLIAIEEL